MAWDSAFDWLYPCNFRDCVTIFCAKISSVVLISEEDSIVLFADSLGLPNGEEMPETRPYKACDKSHTRESIMISTEWEFTLTISDS